MEGPQREANKERCSDRSIPLSTLRELRRSRGLSQRGLGRLAGVSANAILRIENGRGAYPVTVRKIAAALRVQPAELVRGPRLG